MPMVEVVRWLLKEGGGGGLTFECFDIPLESTPTQYISTTTINHLSAGDLYRWRADSPPG